MHGVAWNCMGMHGMKAYGPVYSLSTPGRLFSRVQQPAAAMAG